MIGKMDCSTVAKLMADYLGDELTAEQREALIMHLAACTVCEAEVRTLQRTIEQMKQLETVSMTNAMAHTRNLAIVRRRPLVQRMFLASLKAAAVLAFGVLVGRYTTPSAAPAPPSSIPVPAPVSASIAPQQPEEHDDMPIHPDWINLARKQVAPRSSFAGRLMLIAESGKPASAG